MNQNNNNKQNNIIEKVYVTRTNGIHELLKPNLEPIKADSVLVLPQQAENDCKSNKNCNSNFTQH